MHSLEWNLCRERQTAGIEPEAIIVWQHQPVHLHHKHTSARVSILKTCSSDGPRLREQVSVLLLKRCQLTTAEWKGERSIHACILTNTQSLELASPPNRNQFPGPVVSTATAAHLIQGTAAL